MEVFDMEKTESSPKFAGNNNYKTPWAWPTSGPVENQVDWGLVADQMIERVDEIISYIPGARGKTDPVEWIKCQIVKNGSDPEADFLVSLMAEVFLMNSIRFTIAKIKAMRSMTAKVTRKYQDDQAAHGLGLKNAKSLIDRIDSHPAMFVAREKPTDGFDVATVAEIKLPCLNDIWPEFGIVTNLRKQLEVAQEAVAAYQTTSSSYDEDLRRERQVVKVQEEALAKANAKIRSINSELSEALYAKDEAFDKLAEVEREIDQVEDHRDAYKTAFFDLLKVVDVVTTAYHLEGQGRRILRSEKGAIRTILGHAVGMVEVKIPKEEV